MTSSLPSSFTDQVGLRGLAETWGQGSFMVCIGVVLAQAVPAHSVSGAMARSTQAKAVSRGYGPLWLVDFYAKGQVEGDQKDRVCMT